MVGDNHRLAITEDNRSWEFPTGEFSHEKPKEVIDFVTRTCDRIIWEEVELLLLSVAERSQSTNTETNVTTCRTRTCLNRDRWFWDCVTWKTSPIGVCVRMDGGKSVVGCLRVSAKRGPWSCATDLVRVSFFSWK